MPGKGRPALICSSPKGSIGLDLRDDTCAELAATYASLRDLMGKWHERNLTWWIIPAGERW